MRNAMESSIEAELGRLFEYCKKSTSMWTALQEMDHMQQQTPVAPESSV